MNNEFLSWNTLLFGVYPYICLSVFAIGSWLRFDREQYGWTSASSQLLSSSGMRWASNLFHVGVILIFFGHLIGLLTPHSVFLMVMGDIEHQYMAISLGLVFGLMALAGGVILWARRYFNQRVSVTSRGSDKFVLSLVMFTLILGLATIPVSIGHAGKGDPRVVTAMAEWIQSIIYLYPNPAYLEGVDMIFKLHVFFGMTVFLVFPFTRLVHIWSVPLGYMNRKYQIVRSKRLKYMHH